LKTPSQEDIQYDQEKAIPIGYIMDCMERPIGAFEISESELRRHLCILGVTGSGKTTTGIILALELSKSRVPVVILDRNGEYAHTLSRVSPLTDILIPGRDLVIPPFESDKNLEPSEQIEDWIETIADYIGVGWDESLSPSQSRTLRAALQECQRKRDDFTISNLIRELRNPGERIRRIKWWRESSESIISRIETFTFGRCKRVFDTDRSRLNLTSIIGPFITIIDLSFFSDDRSKNLFSQLFSRKLGKYLREIGETRDLRLVYLVDEAQNVAPQRLTSDSVTRMGVVERFAVELRKYGVGLVTMVTRPTLISKNILANSNTIINHCLFYEDDVRRMKETLGLRGTNEPSDQSAEQCLRTLEPGRAIVRYGSCEAPFLVEIGNSSHRELLLGIRNRTNYRLPKKAISGARS
jgi:DNA helicase HerA-like ATPase